jgi:hypothetical protein
MAEAKLPRRRPGEHGPLPLSRRTRAKLLNDLLRRADAGDVEAAAALVRLGLALEEKRDGKADATDAVTLP